MSKTQLSHDTVSAKQIVFTLDDVGDWQTLAAGIPANAEFHLLSSRGDALAQMATVLSGRNELAAIHLVSHGGAGSLSLGTTTLNNSTLPSHASDLATIGAALAADGDLLLYGCDVAAGEAGQDFITHLALATGADVAASTDRTGSASQGGDSALEAMIGTIEATSLDLAGLARLLAAGISLTGSDDNDTLTGSSADDTLSGGQGNDSLVGLDGNDSLDGGSGNDTLQGGTGDDDYVIDNPYDVIQENFLEGMDRVRVAFSVAGGRYTLARNVELATLVSDGNYSLTGNESHNYLIGNSAANTLEGAAGNDTLEGGGGADSMAGGNGNDGYYVDHAGDVVYEASSAGNDTVFASVGYSLDSYEASGVENLTLLGGADPLNATGNALANRLTGNAGKNRLVGGAGDDTLDGGADSDTLEGGIGNDTYIIDAEDDKVDETGGTGIDNVFASVSYTLDRPESSGVENLTLTGTDNLNATGNALSNKLTGNGGDNRLDGGTGGDIMAGGGGNDTYVIDSMQDIVTEGLNAGTDLVEVGISWMGASYALAQNVENATLKNSVAFNLVGNALDNWLTGNDQNNLLNGGQGNDTFTGGLGSDSFTVDAGIDTITDLTTADKLDIKAGATAIVSGVLNLTGHQINNAGTLVMVGSAAGETLVGSLGVDAIVGGAGSDSMNGGAGADIFVIAAASDYNGDTIVGGAGADIIRFTSANAGETLVLNANLSDVDNMLSISVSDADGITSATTPLNVNASAVTLSRGVTVTGNAGSNALTGSAQGDTISGGAGADTLTGGLGADRLDGSDGDDIFIVAATGDYTGDTVTGGAGADQMRFTSTTAGDTLTLNANLSDSNNQITVAASDASGSTAGTTNLNISAAAVTLTGVYLIGNAGANRLTGSNLGDTLAGGAGADTLAGGGGNDTVSYADITSSSAHGLTQLTGVAINLSSDTIAATAVASAMGGTVVLGGGNGTAGSALAGRSAGYLANTAANSSTGMVRDSLSSIEAATGSALADYLLGSSSDDTLSGGGGADYLSGGNGNDSFAYALGAELSSGESLIGGAGTDTLRLAGSSQTYTLEHAAQFSSIEAIDSSAATNTIEVNFTDNQFASITHIRGGSANETYRLHASNTSGVKTINLSLLAISGSTASGDGFEILGAASSETGTGYAITTTTLGDSVTLVNGSNTITGGSGQDSLSGGSGSDTITGNAGNDYLFGDEGNDLLTAENNDLLIDGGSGVDTVRFSSSAGSGLSDLELVDVEVIEISATNGGNFDFRAQSESLQILGNKGNDTIQAGSGNDTLGGGLGNDSLDGGAGNDVFLIASPTEYGTDTLVGGAGADTLRFTSTTAGQTLTLNKLLSDSDKTMAIVIGDASGSTAGTTALNVNAASVLLNYGVSITGNSGANALTGSGFSDTLIGGAGADQLTGGNGLDTVSYADVSSTSSHGLSRISGMAINLSGNAVTAATIASAMGGTVTLGGGNGVAGAALAANSAGYLVSSAADSSTGMVRDTLTGFEAVTGSSLADYLLGGTGNDTLRGSGGADYLSGGNGNDLFAYSAGEELAPGEALIGGAGSDTIKFGGVNQTYSLRDAASFSSIEAIDSSEASETLDVYFSQTQFASITSLKGGAAIESYQIDVTATSGNRALNLSALTLSGMTANTDRFVIHAAATSGTGTGYTITTSKLGDSVTLVNGSNTLNGGDGNDRLTGGSGNDALTGGAGDDLLDLSNGGTDTVRFAASATLNGSDLITGFTAGIAAGYDVLRLSGMAGLEGSAGSAFAGTIDAYGASSAGDLSLNGRVALLNTGGLDASQTTTINAFITGLGNAFSLGANQSGVVIAALDGDATFYVWRIENDGVNALLDNEIKLVGTIASTGDTIADLNSANFSFA